jgi:dihydrolipoamide dehydrogenase
MKVIVIGNGPAGVMAAKTAAKTGATTLLIGDGACGGRANWFSLVPSKVMISVGDHIQSIRKVLDDQFKMQGLRIPEMPHITGKIAEKAAAWSTRNEAELKDLRVKMIRGNAKFKDKRTIEILNHEGKKIDEIRGDKFIIASGSVAVHPVDIQPDGDRIITPRHVQSLAKIPQDVIVVGAGVTGCEFAYLFSQLGSRVVWIVDKYGILPKFHYEIATAIKNSMIDAGVTIVSGFFARSAKVENDLAEIQLENDEIYQAEMAFLAMGRVPDLARLNISSAGIRTTADGFLEVNEYGQLSDSDIYAIGDATGEPMIANKAVTQAWIAARHACGEDVEPYNQEAVVRAVFTTPEAAEVGSTVVKPGDIDRIKMPFGDCLNAQIHANEHGEICLYYSTISHQIVGGTAVGNHAADLMSIVAHLIQMESRLEDLSVVSSAYPTISELIYMAAQQALTSEKIVA